MFIRVYDGDIDITVEYVKESIFQINIIDGPENAHMVFGISKDKLLELQAKLQVMVENAD